MKASLILSIVPISELNIIWVIGKRARFANYDISSHIRVRNFACHILVKYVLEVVAGICNVLSHLVPIPKHTY